MLHIEMEGVAVVFDAIDDPGRADTEAGLKRRNKRGHFQLWPAASLVTGEDGTRAAAAGRREEVRSPGGHLRSAQPVTAQLCHK